MTRSFGETTRQDFWQDDPELTGGIYFTNIDFTVLYRTLQLTSKPSASTLGGLGQNARRYLILLTAALDYYVLH